MLTERMKTLIREMPKGENHIHIEGSIPARTALKLSKRNGVALPFDSEAGMKDFMVARLTCSFAASCFSDSILVLTDKFIRPIKSSSACLTSLCRSCSGVSLPIVHLNHIRYLSAVFL
nr:hypothetical protein [uncultured Dysosmobacter sp.]